MIASGGADQAKLPAGPSGDGGSFDDNLRSALQANQVDSAETQNGTSLKATGGLNTSGTAKSGPQRARKDAATDGSASGQVGVSVPLVPVQDGVLSWQIPTGASFALQVPALSSGASTGDTSALHVATSETGLPLLEMTAAKPQPSEKDATLPIASPALGTTPSADATGQADLKDQDHAPTHTLQTAHNSLQIESAFTPAPASLGGHLQAPEKGAAQAQMAASPQPVKNRVIPKSPVTLASDSLPAAGGTSNPAPTVVPPPQSSEAFMSPAGVTDLLNPATRNEGEVTNKNKSRMIQTAPEGDPSSAASMQTQVQDPDPASFSLLVGSDQGDAGTLKSVGSTSSTGSKADIEKTVTKSSLLDALSPALGSVETADRGQGQPHVPLSDGGVHQASAAGPSQAGEVQTQGAVGANLQRVLQHSEVRVHIDAAEYGRVSVHASYGREGLAARIRLEDTALGSALGSALSAGAPGLEQRLRGDLGTRALVSVSTDTGSTRSDGEAGQGESRSREQTRVPLTSRNPSTTYAMTTTPVPTIVRGNASGTRLDVRI